MGNLSVSSSSLALAALRARINGALVPAKGSTAKVADGASVTISPEGQRLADQVAKGSSAPPNPSASLIANAKTFLDQLNAANKADRDPKKRIAEAREKLEKLLLRMQRAALMGDKRAVAAMAKEAAGLAREVAAAVKDAAADAKNGGTAPAVGDFSAVAQAASAAAGVEASAGAATSKPSELSSPVADATSTLASQALANTGKVDEGLLREISKALGLVRTIVAMAKATIESKKRPENTSKDERLHEKDFRKEVNTAANDIRESEKDIQAALQQLLGGTSVGAVLHVSQVA